MKITNIDAIMARSLRSLAGFCMGEYGIFELEIILLQLLFKYLNIYLHYRFF